MTFGHRRRVNRLLSWLAAALVGPPESIDMDALWAHMEREERRAAS